MTLNNAIIINKPFYFPNREKEPIIYDGDLMDEEGVLDFLTSLEAMDLPDRIEEVNAKILLKIIEETDFVAVLFCKYFGSLDLFSIYVNIDIYIKCLHKKYTYKHSDTIDTICFL